MASKLRNIRDGFVRLEEIEKGEKPWLQIDRWVSEKYGD
ncbi:predicted protein [Sclerotinia sclerotiorum 1980 UF-70]|uniref:Uncharacterized protein n=1 Tax=Sclerotinia sclerotiorum (strain ATCC 18683 / 1980 / Ss-1) TaxID=665079 RepID=A7F4D0_SCLS1|nr:predicted protein [Sclerotinia sclerotiorum 1980 UF-70]EDN97601.1 predicted protein [Sclerotinia sclerotiorum 1980 UF-70]